MSWRVFEAHQAHVGADAKAWSPLRINMVVKKDDESTLQQIFNAAEILPHRC